jgi:hypothetical protein
VGCWKKMGPIGAVLSEWWMFLFLGGQTHYQFDSTCQFDSTYIYDHLAGSHGVMLNLAALSFVSIALAFGIAASVRVGMCMGARSVFFLKKNFFFFFFFSLCSLVANLQFLYLQR